MVTDYIYHVEVDPKLFVFCLAWLVDWTISNLNKNKLFILQDLITGRSGYLNGSKLVENI